MLINEREQDNCWCPLCKQDKQKIGALYPWYAPEGRLVCTYALCTICDAAADNADKRLQNSVLQEIEKSLLTTYPPLKNFLPSGYNPSTRKIHLIHPTNFTVHIRSTYPPIETAKHQEPPHSPENEHNPAAPNPSATWLGAQRGNRLI